MQRVLGPAPIAATTQNFEGQGAGVTGFSSAGSRRTPMAPSARTTSSRSSTRRSPCSRRPGRCCWAGADHEHRCGRDFRCVRPSERRRRRHRPLRPHRRPLGDRAVLGQRRQRAVLPVRRRLDDDRSDRHLRALPVQLPRRSTTIQRWACGPTRTTSRSTCSRTTRSAAARSARWIARRC